MYCCNFCVIMFQLHCYAIPDGIMLSDTAMLVVAIVFDIFAYPIYYSITNLTDALTSYSMHRAVIKFGQQIKRRRT
jgi:hypothetical protein